MKTIVSFGILVLMVFVVYFYSQSHNRNQKICLSILFTVIAVSTLPFGGGTAFLLIAFVLLVNAFARPQLTHQHTDEKWAEGLNSFEQGKLYYNAKKFNKALRCFDVAVDCKLKQAELFALRGGCLQALQQHHAAIEEFSKAIALDHNDCNLFVSGLTLTS